MTRLALDVSEQDRCGDAGRTLTSHLKGGDLTLEWREADDCVYKTGPAQEIFTTDWPV